MYQEAELTQIRAQLNKRKALVWLPAVLLGAAAAAAIIRRAGLCADAVKALHDEGVMRSITACEIIAYAAVILAVVWLVFGLGLFCGPLKRYAAMLDGVLHGRNHTVTGAWAGAAEALSEVDGVTCRAVGLTVQDEKGRDWERLFYWDNEKPLPDFAPGETVEITHHGKQVVRAASAAKP